MQISLAYSMNLNRATPVWRSSDDSQELLRACLAPAEPELTTTLDEHQLSRSVQRSLTRYAGRALMVAAASPAGAAPLLSPPGPVAGHHAQPLRWSQSLISIDTAENTVFLINRKR